jgi:subtilisin family serine protease
LNSRDSVRIAVVDSGIDSRHVEPDCRDFLGHGTAVAGMILERAPTAEIFAIKIFDRTLTTKGNDLLRAIDWCLDARVDFVNLSLGTLNRSYVTALQERVEAAQRVHTQIVSAFAINNELALPG